MRILFRGSKPSARAAALAGAAAALALLSSGPAAAQTTLTAPTIDTAACVSGLCYDSDNFGSIFITWNNPNTGADTRLLLLRLGAGASAPAAPPSSLSDPSVLFNGLGTSPHYFRGLDLDRRHVVFVRAEQSGMTSSSWVRTAGALRTRLPAVTGLQLEPAAQGFRAAWNPLAVFDTSLASVSYRLTYECSPSASVTVTGISTTSRQVTGLQAGRPCSVGVVGFAGGRLGMSMSSEPTVVPVYPTPARVLGVRVTPRDGALHVSWSAASGPVSQYRVHAEDASGRFRRVYADAGVLEAVVDGLVNGVEYTVTVTALVPLGADGPSSESRTAAPGVAAPPAPSPPPAPPSQVTGVRVAPLDGGLRVSWSAAAGDVSQYRVDAADAAGELVRRVHTGADVFEALLDRLVNGVEYTVTVTALTGHPDVAGPSSEPRPATPQAPPSMPPPPSQVTGVRVAPLDGGLRISWDAAAGEVSQYRVAAADASGRFHRAYTSADVLEVVLDGLVNGVEYTVTVTALMSDGEDGAPSEPRTAAPAADGGDPGGDVPVPALPLAGAGVLAGLLAATGAYRRRRAARAPAA